MKIFIHLFFLLVLPMIALTQETGKTVTLSSLDLSNMKQSNGRPRIYNESDKRPMTIAGQTFSNGVGTRIKSTLWIDLAGKAERFKASVGIDDDTGHIVFYTKHNFKVIGDGRKLWESGPMDFHNPAKNIDLDIRGIRTLVLTVVNAGDLGSYVQTDWADARFIVNGADPVTIPAPVDEAIILTPAPAASPRINGPQVYGCRPGSPFLFRIPASGNRPMHFSATGLPAGLKLDNTTGIITGKVLKRGDYTVVIKAQNKNGTDSRLFRISCGDKLALTPPMGWNDWYTHFGNITDQKMRQAADLMQRNGMADVGYQYINVDDCWMNAESTSDKGRVGPLRNAAGDIQPNSYFPDMKGMTDYIHERGLKAGIYSSPGPTTCGGYGASAGHEAQDARQFANWGFDFLKYDWCSYGEVVGRGPYTSVQMQKPFRDMGKYLREQKRDMLFNLCQYGMDSVWKWGAEAGQSWRTGADLGLDIDIFYDVAIKNAMDYGSWSRPGGWNDPDYLQIGFLSNAPCKLSPTEQYSFMSLWCLLASPLFYSGDMAKLDDFTLNILTNAEVIAVNQDPLGKSAIVTDIDSVHETLVMVKDMEDGSKAVGLCNQGLFPAVVKYKWKDVMGQRNVRDLWRQKDLGVFENEFSATVPARGVVMLRVSQAGKKKKS
jgi:alpha-galactosidase